ncbi:p47 [Pseudomonas phage PaP2]|uniref:hypothetical protein n=1 Tax=Pseudomonas phage PaP2 TaxID=270673 RepID=UPI00003593E3|nr:hypothetical protein PaP2_gp47 [Pseudomonas phage PaP2]AAS89633.1 p47 [Pseudomonas phage PaP2]
MNLNNLLGLIQFYPIHLSLILVLALATIMVSLLRMKRDELAAIYHNLSELWWKEEESKGRWDRIIANIHMRAFLTKCIVVCRVVQILVICLIIGISL